MKPCRELDAIVAEKVMGWTKGSTEGTWFAPGWTVPEFWPTPKYSTSIAAAFEVVEKLTCKTIPHFELSIFKSGWHAAFDLDWPFKRVVAKGESAPHAICLAALKAIGAM